MTEFVHQTAEMKGQVIKTKCGVEGRSDKVAHSAWHSEINCPACLGGHDADVDTGVLGGDTGP